MTAFPFPEECLFYYRTWNEMNKAFSCRKCGNCCRVPGYVRIRETEIDRIAGYLKMDSREFNEKYTILTNDRRSLSLREKDDGSCVFLSGTSGECLINPVKPEQCMNFPFKWNFEGWETICKAAANRNSSQE